MAAKAQLGAGTDRRVARTRRALMNAFVDLLLERGYPGLSVADVTQRADVGRSTFYAHFAGIDGILRESLTFPSSQLAIVVDQELEPNALVNLLIHMRDQRRLNRVFFAPPIRSVWARCLADLIEPRLAALARAGAGPRLPLGLAAAQIAESQLSLIINWLTARTAVPPETISQTLIALTRANVATLLG